jgi:hypothetical protein
MPQINSGKSPPWVSGEIVTAAGLNGMIDSATLDPSAVTAQSDFPTLTGDEYTLIVDPSTGFLKKTQLKNALLTGEDVKTDSITQTTGSSTTLLIQSNPSVAMIVDGIGGLTLRSQSSNIGIDTLSAGGGGNLSVQTNGMTFDGQGGSGTGVINFLTRTTFSNTGAVKLPVGTTAQRPSAPVTGDTRFNTTTTRLEFYNGTSWISIASRDPAVSVLELYEIYEEAIPSTSGRGITVTTSSFTKPTNEVWVFEVLLNSTGTYFSSASVSVYFDVYLNSLLQYYYQANVVGAGSKVFSSHCAKWKIDSATSLSAQPITLNFGPHTTLSIDNAKLFIYKYKTA